MTGIAGWMGKIAWINLSTKKIEIDDSCSYYHDYIGGRGLAARLAWDIFSRGTEALSEENTMIFMTGPLTGTSAPYSGRTTICSLAPQGHPHEYPSLGLCK